MTSYPTITEVHNAESFFNPSLGQPRHRSQWSVGLHRIVAQAPAIAPRRRTTTTRTSGRASALPTRLTPGPSSAASYGIMFSHGGAVGGLNTSIGTLGFSAAPAFSVNGSDVTTMPGLLAGGSGAIPAYTGATGVASGPAYGTGYLKTATLGAVTGTPSTMTYDDPYYGGRAPEFENWSFGIQQQLTNAMALNITYVGSEGPLPATG